VVLTSQGRHFPKLLWSQLALTLLACHFSSGHNKDVKVKCEESRVPLLSAGSCKTSRIITLHFMSATWEFVRWFWQWYWSSNATSLWRGDLSEVVLVVAYKWGSVLDSFSDNVFEFSPLQNFCPGDFFAGVGGRKAFNSQLHTVSQAFTPSAMPAFLFVLIILQIGCYICSGSSRPWSSFKLPSVAGMIALCHHAQPFPIEMGSGNCFFTQAGWQLPSSWSQPPMQWKI
jgi:hypothetical protein